MSSLEEARQAGHGWARRYLVGPGEAGQGRQGTGIDKYQKKYYLKEEAR
jgi:hypothetical protein